MSLATLNLRKIKVTRRNWTEFAGLIEEFEASGGTWSFGAVHERMFSTTYFRPSFYSHSGKNLNILLAALDNLGVVRYD